MSARGFVASVLALACGGGALACHHHTHAQKSGAPATSDTSRSAGEDSLAGTVSITGTSFEQHIVLRTGASVRPLTLRRDDSASFALLGGVDVLVRGIAAEDAFEVHSFVVRAVDGAPVVDGVLGRTDGHLVLLTASGLLELGNPPAALDSLVSSRVWIGGPLATGPNVYGIIRRVTDASSAPSQTPPARPPRTTRRR